MCVPALAVLGLPATPSRGGQRKDESGHGSEVKTTFKTTFKTPFKKTAAPAPERGKGRTRCSTPLAGARCSMMNADCWQCPAESQLTSTSALGLGHTVMSSADRSGTAVHAATAAAREYATVGTSTSASNTEHSSETHSNHTIQVLAGAMPPCEAR